MVLKTDLTDLFPGKMVLLDKLLPKLKERDSRVLIFSQVIEGSVEFIYLYIDSCAVYMKCVSYRSINFLMLFFQVCLHHFQYTCFIYFSILLTVFMIVLWEFIVFR